MGPKGVAPGCGSEREAIHFSILCVRRGHANREGIMRPPGFGLWASEASWVGWGSSCGAAEELPRSSISRNIRQNQAPMLSCNRFNAGFQSPLLPLSGGAPQELPRISISRRPAKAFLPKLDDSIAFWSFLSVSSRRDARKAEKCETFVKIRPQC